MRYLNFDPVIRRFIGKRGGFVYKKRNGKPYVAIVPDRSHQIPTNGELNNRRKFKAASGYAKAIHADPAARAPYESAARIRGTTAYNLIVRDYYHSPVIEQIDLSAYAGSSGDVIAITATDDFEVVRVVVTVTIRDESGSVIEGGDAAFDAGRSQWLYAAVTNGADVSGASVIVQAYDRPGNTGTREVRRTIGEPASK